MDNFMEQPTYKMNRGAILTQGWRGLAHGINERIFCGRHPSVAASGGQAIPAVTGSSRPIACKRE
ncbi:hypothetical protein FQ187_14935 [Pseudomonas sp. ANT_J28]|nr:hypothetical protein FQ187_14935 [Pseudomonas sp. ANT_J28]